MCFGGVKERSHSRQVLAVSPSGVVNPGELQAYRSKRQRLIATRLEELHGTEMVNKWFDELLPGNLFENGDEQKYLGNQSSKDEALNSDRKDKALRALQRAKAASTFDAKVAAMEDLIFFFCGFDIGNAVCLINAVHFQFEVDVAKLLSTVLPALSAAESESALQIARGIFDESNVSSAELLLRAVVQRDDGTLIASPFSPGMPMSFLLKLPLYAQLVMVLTNVVEATWYEEDIPNCPVSINLYASLLVDAAPILDLVKGVHVVEVMEMTKGAKRGPDVVTWVEELRNHNIKVLLDDFDPNHPAADSKPDGIKVCVFANAFHSRQAFKEDGAPLDMSAVNKEHGNHMDFKDFYKVIVPKMQPCIKTLIMEGSENCLKSETKGPPLNFDEPKATLATAHVYQAAARALTVMEPSIRMFQQGGRALYEWEDFDASTCELIQSLGIQMAMARRGHAGTLAWVGDEASRRAALKVRPLVCGVVLVDKSAPTMP